MLDKSTLCRALGTHAWDLRGPIFVVGTARKITFQCARCDSVRIDTWAPSGAQLKRTYHREDDYSQFIKSNTRMDAREVVIEGAATRPEKEQHNESHSPRVRSLPTARNNKSRTHKRASKRRPKGRLLRAARS
jgi:hypothetical protein